MLQYRHIIAASLFDTEKDILDKNREKSISADSVEFPIPYSLSHACVALITTAVVTGVCTDRTGFVAFSVALITEFHATFFAHDPLIPSFQVSFFSTAVALEGLTFGANGLVVVVAFF